MSEIYTVLMPDIGEGVAEGEVIEWLKKVNDPVVQDEPIVIMMTDKATVELPAPYPGVLTKQHHKAGEMAAKGKPLYDLQLNSDAAAAAAAHVKKGSSNNRSSSRPPCSLTAKSTNPIEALRQPSESLSRVAELPTSFGQAPENSVLNKMSTDRVMATPVIRKLARDLDIDIHRVVGSGQDGRITVNDLKQFIVLQATTSTQGMPSTHREDTCSQTEATRPHKRAYPQITCSTPLLKLEGDEEVPIMGLRNIIAEKMVESKLLIPHFTYSDQLDATRLMQLRENMKGEAAAVGIKLTYMPFFIRALSLALKIYPQINGSVEVTGKKLVVHKQHNMGLAMKTSMGLVAPVLQRVENMSLAEIIQAFDALKSKAMAGELAPSDMKNSTITVSNFGTLGGMWATPIINYPEIAILGIAKIRQQPVVKNNAVVIRPILNLSWSFDHRVIDGDSAAEFSNAFINYLENPASLL